MWLELDLDYWCFHLFSAWPIYIHWNIITSCRYPKCFISFLSIHVRGNLNQCTRLSILLTLSLCFSLYYFFSLFFSERLINIWDFLNFFRIWKLFTNSLSLSQKHILTSLLKQNDQNKVTQTYERGKVKTPRRTINDDTYYQQSEYIENKTTIVPISVVQVSLSYFLCNTPSVDMIG